MCKHPTGPRCFFISDKSQKLFCLRSGSSFVRVVGDSRLLEGSVFKDQMAWPRVFILEFLLYCLHKHGSYGGGRHAALEVVILFLSQSGPSPDRSCIGSLEGSADTAFLPTHGVRW